MEVAMPTPDRTSHAEIVAAGRDLLEEGGPDAVTMRAVAARVGVRPPSLYKRVDDRAALIRDVAASAVDELGVLLRAGDASIAHLVDTIRAYAHRHPEAFRLIFTTAPPREALEHAVAPLLHATTEIAGEEHALDAARLLTAWAVGFLQMELAGAFRLGGDVDAAYAYGLRTLIDSITRHGTAGPSPTTT